MNLHGFVLSEDFVWETSFSANKKAASYLLTNEKLLSRCQWCSTPHGSKYANWLDRDQASTLAQSSRCILKILNDPRIKMKTTISHLTIVVPRFWLSVQCFTQMICRPWLRYELARGVDDKWGAVSGPALPSPHYLLYPNTLYDPTLPADTVMLLCRLASYLNIWSLIQLLNWETSVAPSNRMSNGI